MQSKISISNLNFYYGKAQALYDITLEIPERQVVAFIGPSGCGKSTFLRTLNRMNDTIPIARAEGTVMIDGENIYAPGTDVVALRRRSEWFFKIESVSKSITKTSLRHSHQRNPKNKRICRKESKSAARRRALDESKDR